MSSFVVKNNAESLVADNPLAQAAVTLNVTASEGANFPSTCPFLITLWDEVVYPDPSDDSGMEIVKCTARTTDALTIVRAQEGTADVAHALGERVGMLITAGILNDATYGLATKLDGIAANANNYSHPSAPPCRAATSGQTGHATAAQILKLNGIATNANNYSHPSARACSSGNWAWASITGKPSYATRWAAWSEVTSKPSTFTPSDHSTDKLTSGTLPVSRGGTGVTGDTYDADKVDGCHAGIQSNNVFKLPSETNAGGIYYVNPSSPYGMEYLTSSTNGYQLTTHGINSTPSWAAASDLIFSDTYCPKCGLEFQDGDNLILHVIGHNEIGDILTIPMHKDCAEAPTKIVMIKRKVMEDQYILDDLTGEPKVQRVQKMQEKTVTKKRTKAGVELNRKTGEFWEMKDGHRHKKITNVEATEEYDDTIEEVVYENVEFFL